jgi:hypothetical protein
VKRFVVQRTNRTRELVLVFALAQVANHFRANALAKGTSNVHLDFGKRWVVARWSAMPSVFANVANEVVSTRPQVSQLANLAT